MILLSNMAPSIEDLFNFLKQDKKERAAERAADKVELRNIISEEVKKEVMSIIEPVEKRVVQVEKVQEDLSDQLKAVNEELKVLKDQMETRGASSIAVVSHPSTGLIKQVENLQNKGETSFSTFSRNNVEINDSQSELLEIISSSFFDE